MKKIHHGCLGGDWDYFSPLSTLRGFGARLSGPNLDTFTQARPALHLLSRPLLRLSYSNIETAHFVLRIEGQKRQAAGTILEWTTALAEKSITV